MQSKLKLKNYKFNLLQNIFIKNILIFTNKINKINKNY
ncbi:MAG: hypothetical protein Terrestrivirus5_193 [Terrestrivirus sp.]|uniref:Uncharacterized protein n=1 Tax=Terrestrivirus sp. TaxID=2487775 RepID=A0A3G4ZQV4_9VIRU|nr:MAG: hypothetical protein Terrestrivirus5_193 [Terrestrivirus sp.]